MILYAVDTADANISPRAAKHTLLWGQRSTSGRCARYRFALSEIFETGLRGLDILRVRILSALQVAPERTRAVHGSTLRVIRDHPARANFPATHRQRPARKQVQGIIATWAERGMVSGTENACLTRAVSFPESETRTE